MGDPQEASEGGRQRPDVGFQSRVAAVSVSGVSDTRLTLPGVMDDEGRVDESRLRMHIFKNGRRASNYASLHPHFFLRLFLV